MVPFSAFSQPTSHPHPGWLPSLPILRGSWNSKQFPWVYSALLTPFVPSDCSLLRGTFREAICFVLKVLQSRANSVRSSRRLSSPGKKSPLQCLYHKGFDSSFEGKFPPEQTAEAEILLPDRLRQSGPDGVLTLGPASQGVLSGRKSQAAGCQREDEQLCVGRGQRDRGLHPASPAASCVISEHLQTTMTGVYPKVCCKH